MKRLLTRMTLLLLLAAVGAWTMPVHAEEEEGAAEAKPKKEGGGEEGEKKKGSDDVSGGRFAGDPIYVHITPLYLPVITQQGIQQIVTVIIDVEVKDVDTADHMHTIMPKVRDSLMRALYGGLGQGTLRDGKLVNVAKIKTKTTTALTELLGPDAVREVLVQGVSQHIF